MKDEFISSIGIYGQRHYRYLRENKPNAINVMRMEGKLEQYLQDVDRQSNEMFSQIVKHLAESEGVTEQLKADNQMKWVCCMNAIRAQATEIVNKELIFV